LDGIVRVGVNSGAKVLLNTVAVNLKDCPPFSSMHSSNLLEADHAQFDQLCTNAMQAMAQKDFSKTSDFFQQATRIDTNFAELQFHWGEMFVGANELGRRAGTIPTRMRQ
jgi:hypothetical protein